MSDDNPHSANGSSGKSWAAKLLQVFAGEPKSREELVDLIQDAEDRDLIDNDTREMIEGVLDVAELKVRDIMIPRSQMVTIDIHQGVDEFLPIVIDSQHSRYPVVTDNKDHVEGILLAKDLLSYGFNMTEEVFSLEKVMRPAVIVPESKRVDVLLKEFRSNRYHMAIVVDEYGGVSGLVTIEDILGEIEDETDAQGDDDKNNIRRLSQSRYSIKALTTIEDFNQYFNTNFSDEEHDTVGGLVAHGFGHLPQAGEEVTLGNMTFRVTNADKRRIQQLQVSLNSDDDGSPESEQ